jgi:hypothetical protein
MFDEIATSKSIKKISINIFLIDFVITVTLFSSSLSKLISFKQH